MKKILLAFVALCALPATAQSGRPFEFELTPGCISNKARATCVVVNRYRGDISCKIAISATTFHGRIVSNVRTVQILGGKFDDSAKLAVPEGDVIIDVRATADCKAE